MRVVVAHRPDQPTRRQRDVPLVSRGERSVCDLDQVVARQRAQRIEPVGVARTRMVERHESCLALDSVDHVLLVTGRLPQRQVEPVDRMRIDRELMILAKVETVLVQREGVDAVERSDTLVIGHAGHRVAKLAVTVRDIRVRLLAARESEPRSSVRVQVRSLPVS